MIGEDSIMENNIEQTEIQGLNHITFQVCNLKKSIEFYKIILGGSLVASSEKLAYFDVYGLWIALNVDGSKQQNKANTYSHVAFSMTLENQEKLRLKLKRNNISFEEGRARNTKEGTSIYIRDLDGHLIEFHNKNLSDRLKYYNDNRQDVKLYNDI